MAGGDDVDVDVASLTRRRVAEAGAVARAWAARRAPAELVDRSTGRTLVIAADHPARGSLGAGPRAGAMADRGELLSRLRLALSRPGVGGVLGTPDVLEDLLLLGALDGKAVYGSMNRGGLAGAAFELDDRFTAYDAATIAGFGLQGGKMLLRVGMDDPASVATLEAGARAVGALAARKRLAMIEPFLAEREGGPNGRLRTVLTADASIRVASIAAGLGTTSAYTWLKLPVTDEMERVAAATTLPVLLLGGEVADDPDAMYARWSAALALPNVIGLVVGRSLLFPPGDDVAAAVDVAFADCPRPAGSGSLRGRWR